MIRIVDPGPLTTIQDLGRHGHLRSGIPASGAMDRFAFVLANRLVGNADNAAALECTLLGMRFEVERACALAVTGADMPLTINGSAAASWRTIALQPGDKVRLGAARTGVRAYVAFAGGIDVPLALGSRSTYVRGRLGGLQGRALRKDDRLRLRDASVPVLRRTVAHAVPTYQDETIIRVALGPQADRFTSDGIATFLAQPYKLLPQSDRMGARFSGPRIAHTHGHDIVSDGIAAGSVQVPGDGQPIVLLADRQSTGGYTKIATVCSFELARIAQLRPGQSARFQEVSIEEAHRLLREYDAYLSSDLLEDLA